MGARSWRQPGVRRERLRSRSSVSNVSRKARAVWTGLDELGEDIADWLESQRAT